MQNKFHFAISGQTAAELIYTKADAMKKHMGLTTWKYAPKGRILKSDAIIAKNYLEENKIKRLERTVSSFFDYTKKSRKLHGLALEMNGCSFFWIFGTGKSLIFSTKSLWLLCILKILKEAPIKPPHLWLG